MTIYADLRDASFGIDPNARFLWGVDGEPFMDSTGGFGYSTALRSAKVLLVDGIVYVPDPAQQRIPKRERDWARYPMVAARIQPPSDRLEIPTWGCSFTQGPQYPSWYCARTAR